MSNSIKEKTIHEICSDKTKFHIPYYQRGYRWTKTEVYDLLDDINDFDDSNHSYYYLQPLVLKKHDENEQEIFYEVIDGQQRLTTIYLILHYLNTDKTFSLSYDKSRQQSEAFLKAPENYCDDNIDFHYISEAYKLITQWFEKNNKIDKFISKLKDYTKFIWYETTEDPIPIFIRLNIGKIRLTNAELIKALFLNSSYYTPRSNKNDSYYKQNRDDIEEDIYHKQLEKALEWDDIEKHLQNDNFWLFLSNNTNHKLSRIEFIFDIIARKSPDYEANEHDTYSTFRYFYNELKNTSPCDRYKKVEEFWTQVTEYYGRFVDWSCDSVLYNKIGYILTEEIATIDELCSNAEKFTKSQFMNDLDEKIKNSFIIDSTKKKKTKLRLEDLEYNRPSCKKTIKSVLLLYNILTMLKSPKDYANHDKTISGEFFPFDLYKKENWDIEHIASQTENGDIPDRDSKTQHGSESPRSIWIKGILPYLDKDTIDGQELYNKILEWTEQFNTKDEIDKIGLQNCISKIKFKDVDEDEFAEVFFKAFRHFHSVDADHTIANLTLLDSNTNRSYRNAVFPRKREIIIDKDKEGFFVPICTKKLFLKSFNYYPSKLYFWDNNDKDKYLEDLKNVLKDYLEVN